MKARFLLPLSLLAALVFLLMTGTAFAASCPYCGQTYGEGPRSDQARLRALREAHEASCPSRSRSSGGGTSNQQQMEEEARAEAERQAEANRQAAEAERQAAETARIAAEAEQQRIAAEKKRQAEEEAARNQAAFERARDNALRDMKGIAGSLGGSQGGTTGTLEMKGLNTTSGLQLRTLADSSVVDLTIAGEQDAFEKRNAAWMKNQRDLIQQRLDKPNKWCSSIYNSLKIKEPPLPDKGFNDLQPGDVLLIEPDGSFMASAIRGGDRFSSWAWNAPASHTLIFLKEVNGKKLFLDNIPGSSANRDAAAGVGPHVITGEQYLKIYGQRGAYVAQPVNKPDAAKLWGAAREVGIKELKDEPAKAGNLVDNTNYGLYGNDNMVCSEASRWVLVQAGVNVPETKSPLKKALGIYYGPSNFYTDDNHFLVTPMVSAASANR